MSAETLPAIELIGQPCRAKNMLAGRIAVDPSTGRDLLLLSDMNEATGMELLVIDVANNTGHSYPAPAGSGSWAFHLVPGDRLVVGTYYDGKFMVFDLRTRQFIHVADFPGESYIWNLAMGKDGRLYGGTYDGGKLGALDLETYAVEDCGAPAPPNLYLRHVSSLPDGRILCSFTTESPLSLIYDPATKAFSPVPPRLAQVANGVSWNGYFLAGMQAYQGTILDVAELPFPAPSVEKGEWSVLVDVTKGRYVFLQQGHALYRYGVGDIALTLLAAVDLRGGRLLDSDSQGNLYGIRGQEYFIIRPGDTDLHLLPVPVESKPRPTLFLKADAAGRVWGGPHFGQTLCYIDTRSGKTVNTPTICDEGGEVYDLTYDGDSVYAAAYSGGSVIRYNPDEPWDQIHDKNPLTLTRLASQGYIRPTGGIVFGPDGKLYTGWTAAYGVYGGAVAITDPANGETELIENPLGQLAIAGLATDGVSIYIGTSVFVNGLPDNLTDMYFGVYSLEARTVISRQQFTGVREVRVRGYDAATRRVVFTVDNIVHLFDGAANRPIDDITLPPLTCYTVAMPGDGTIIYASEQEILIADLASSVVLPVAHAPAPVGNVTCSPAGIIYFSCGTDVYRVVPA